MKKVNGANAEKHYEGKFPEFTRMSLRPGVGSGWLKKFATDIYPDDFVVINSKKMRPPRYYDTQHEVANPEAMQSLKWTRKKQLRKHSENNTKDRLKVRETILNKKMEYLARNHDNEE